VIPALFYFRSNVVIATFRKEELASGNVDARLIREIAKLYGFSVPSMKSDELLTVKTNRNDLAHGQKSFAEVGRDFDVARLEQIRSVVIAFFQTSYG
jgi:HEPN superfamily protein